MQTLEKNRYRHTKKKQMAHDTIFFSLKALFYNACAFSTYIHGQDSPDFSQLSLERIKYLQKTSSS